MKPRLNVWTVMLIQGVFIVLTMVATIALAVWLSSEVSERQARDRAQALSEVVVCKRQVLNAPSTLRILDALTTSIENSIATTQAAMGQAEANDPLLAVRKASLKRNEAALADMGRFRTQINRQTPTVESCNELARDKDVPLPFPQKEGA